MNDFSQVNIGIVGPGAIGRYHAASLARLGANLHSVSGPNPARTAEMAERYRVDHVHGSLEELLAADDLDGVVIASPSDVHAEQTLAVIEAGLPVLCEIPLALNIGDVERLQRAAADNASRVMVAHTRRYIGVYRHLIDLVEAGEATFTNILAYSLTLRHENVGWTGRQRSWVDNVLWHHGAHLVDLALMLLNDEEISVAGWSGPPWSGSGQTMDVAGTLRTSDGRLASVALSYHSQIELDEFVLVGPRETYRVVDGALFRGDHLVLAPEASSADEQPGQDAQTLDFLRLVKDGTPSRADLDSIARTMRAIAQLDSSAK